MTSGNCYKRIVVKLGSNLLTAGTDRLDLEVMASIVGQVAKLHAQGKELIVVSSGAIAAGKHKLGITRERRGIPFRQVLAAVGQSHLMDAYDQLFSWHGIIVAQTLLTRTDLADRQGYLNARNTLLALMDLKVISIVNENDVVAVDEIQGATFGDNDNLSAMVATLVDADALIILTDIGGLYTADPTVDPSAELIETVDSIDQRLEALAGRSNSGRGTGGMATKLQAAKMATSFGISTFIASGRERNVLVRLSEGEKIGTRFAVHAGRMESRKRWMLSGLSQRGTIIVDKGAVKAITEQHRSLLPAGVSKVVGEFGRGDVVAIVGPDQTTIAYGVVNYNSRDVSAIEGKRSSQIQDVLGYQYGEEVVHRNNLVLK